MSRWIWILGTLIGVGGAGFFMKPKPFPDYPDRTPDFDTMPLPDDLPHPVRRFYQKITDGDLPIVTSSVITARGKLRFGGIPFQARLRFVHQAGYAHRQYIELTWFNLPFLKVNEHFIDGKFSMKIPFAESDTSPDANASANQALWGEALFFPTFFVTDSRPSWQAIDDTSAKLIVPYPHGEEKTTQEFTVTFDPTTDLITKMETSRYRDAESGYVDWVATADRWKRFNGVVVPTVGTVQWMDQDYAWLTMTVEDVVFNIDVSGYVAQDGL